MTMEETKIRTRDKVRTRQEILAAATIEFAKSGFEGAKTVVIAKRANVAKRMLYHYFVSKDGLFQAVLEQTYIEIRTAEENLKLTSLDPVEAMADLVKFSFDWFVKHPEFIAILNEENLLGAVHAKSSKTVKKLNMPLVDTITSVLARGEKSGQFRENVDPVELYISIAGISYFYFSNQHTLSAIFTRDLSSKTELVRRRAHVIEVILGFLRP